MSLIRHAVISTCAPAPEPAGRRPLGCARTASARTASRGRIGGLGLPFVLAVGLGGLLAAAGAEAASRTGALGAPASAAMLLPVECFDSGSGAPASLVIEVANRAPISGAFVSAQIRKGNFATSTTDPIDDDGLTSPSVFVNGGAGRYEVYVDKSGAGDEAFELTAQCFTGAAGTGLMAGTTILSTAGGSVPSGRFGAWSLLATALALTAMRALHRPASA
jgi:hypothetical protein